MDQSYNPFTTPPAGASLLGNLIGHGLNAVQNLATYHNLHAPTGAPRDAGTNIIYSSNGMNVPPDNAAPAQQPQTQTQQPNTAAQPGVDSTLSGTGASNPYGQQYAAYYQDTINQLTPQLGQLDNQQNIGLQNIGNSYNLAQNRADQQQAADQRNYQTQLGQNQQSYINNRNSILQNTLTQQNALQRLLGIAGSGNSSAAYEQAPYAAGLQGSQQLFGAQNAYGQNENSLNTGWNDYTRNFQNSLQDLKNQKYQQQQNLQSSIAQTRANLLNQIAQANVYRDVAQGQNYQTALNARAPFQSQINNLLSQITQLGNQWQNPQIQTGPVTYQAPAMNNFGFQAGPAPTSQNDANNSGDVLPSFLNVLQPKRDQYGQVVNQ